MRRKSERTAGKKTKASPEKVEKKVEKPKRTRARRKKQSTSSDNESADDASPIPEAPVVAEPEVKPPTTPVKGENLEESQDQVWQVKTAAAGDVGEIQKLKICLTRPPSTPERAERSPRSKRKHSRATSSSDTPSAEAPEERRKSRHRSKRSHRESKDDLDKNLDSQGEETEVASDSREKNDEEVTQSEEEQKADTSATSENTISTSDEKKPDQDQAQSNTSEEIDDKKDKVESSDDVSGKGDGSTDKTDKSSDADTTVVSPKAETTAVSAPAEVESSINTESQDSQSDANTSDMASHSQSPARRRSMSVDKSEILELHPEESKLESDLETDKTKTEDTMEDANTSQEEEEKQVSKTEENSPINKTMLDNDKSNVTGVVEKSMRTRNISDSHIDVCKSTDSNEEFKDKRRRSQSIDSSKDIKKSQESKPQENHKTLEHSDSTQSNHDETHNGQAIIPIVVSRKRRWGSRPAKITTQKSITISTDILKDIIPDVKPAEFEEVIEEKKHKREREVVEKIERPILPKIIIDNTAHVERQIDHRRHSGEKDRDRDTMKPKEPQMAANRKISIIKDNDSIIARPPSPPRNKQSSVLYITNLVRPFTLLQLKNLLQRTGRLAENGFWIDKIKSKCYVIYEDEDQAVETRHALHGVTWPVSNPKTLQVDFSTQEAFDKAKTNEVADNAQVSTIPGTVEDWLREQDMKRERGEMEKPWERKVATREWDLGKNDKDKETKDKPTDKRREEQRPLEKRRHNRTPERSPEPARKFKKKEEEPPAKLLDDLFKKTKATPCIYWLPLSAETIAIKEEQRRQHMAEHERRMLEQRTRAARRH